MDALQINTAFEFSVTLDGEVTENTEIPVVFARKGDITVKPERTVEIQAKGVYNGRPLATELVKVSYTDTLVADNNGVYRFGTAEGAMVVVQMKNPVAPVTKALNALDAADYVYTAEDTEHASDVNYPTIKNDYSSMIKDGGYGKKADGNGAVVLTEELAGFLKLFAAKNAVAIKASDNTATDANAWHFALYYYTPAQAIDLEPLYDNETGEPTGNPVRVNVSVPAGKTVYYSMSQVLPMGGMYTVLSENPNAKAFYNGTPYGGTGEGFEFTAAVGGMEPEVAFAITTADGNAGSISIFITVFAEPDGTMEHPFVLEEGTPVSITLAEDNDPRNPNPGSPAETFVNFTATNAGRYQITFTETNVFASYLNAAWEPVDVYSTDEFIITLEAEELFELSFLTNGTERLTFDVTIEYLGA